MTDVPVVPVQGAPLSCAGKVTDTDGVTMSACVDWPVVSTGVPDVPVTGAYIGCPGTVGCTGGAPMFLDAYRDCVSDDQCSTACHEQGVSTGAACADAGAVDGGLAEALFTCVMLIEMHEQNVPVSIDSLIDGTTAVGRLFDSGYDVECVCDIVESFSTVVDANLSIDASTFCAIKNYIKSKRFEHAIFELQGVCCDALSLRKGKCKGRCKLGGMCNCKGKSKESKGLGKRTMS